MGELTPEQEEAVMAGLMQIHGKILSVNERLKETCLRHCGRLPELSGDRVRAGDLAGTFDWSLLTAIQIAAPQAALMEAKLGRKLKPTDVILAKSAEKWVEPYPADKPPKARIYVVNSASRINVRAMKRLVPLGRGVISESRLPGQTSRRGQGGLDPAQLLSFASTCHYPNAKVPGCSPVAVAPNNLRFEDIQPQFKSRRKTCN